MNTPDPILIAQLERTLAGLKAAPVPVHLARNALASGLRQARSAVVQPGSHSRVAGAMIHLAMGDTMSAHAPNPNRVYPMATVARSAGSTYTIHSAVLESSRVCQAGVTLIPIDDAPDPVEDVPGIVAWYKREARFANVKPAGFAAVAAGANVNTIARPVLSADIDLGEASSHAVRFSISRDDQKAMSDDAMQFEIERSIAAGLGQLADAVMLQALAAKNPAVFTIAAAAASGVRFPELSALVGTAGTGATVNAAGDLVAAGVRADLTDRTALTLVGAFSRAALACENEIRVLMERRSLQGALDVTVFTTMQALIPDASVFWKLA